MAVLAGCGRPGDVAVAVPSPPPAQVAPCASIIGALPDDVVPGQRHRTTHPRSRFTAAFGSPAVTVRCGGSVPAHDPAAFVEQVNDVEWLQLSGDTGPQHYVTLRNSVVVEVTIPVGYLPADVLLGITPAVQKYGRAELPAG